MDMNRLPADIHHVLLSIRRGLMDIRRAAIDARQWTMQVCRPTMETRHAATHFCRAATDATPRAMGIGRQRTDICRPTICIRSFSDTRRSPVAESRRKAIDIRRRTIGIDQTTFLGRL